MPRRGLRYRQTEPRGEIPSELGQLFGLEELWLSDPIESAQIEGCDQHGPVGCHVGKAAQQEPRELVSLSNPAG